MTDVAQWAATAVRAVQRTQFAPRTTYLDTASQCLLPLEAGEAVREAVDETVTGRADPARWTAAIEGARDAFARLVDTVPDRVALGTAVAVHVGLVADTLPPGARVLVPEGEFTSVVTPFTTRGDLTLRQVPPQRLVEAVEPRTALVALSVVRSVDGKITDLSPLRRATAAVGARLLVDATQAVGWLPVRADDADFVLCGAYKWLMCPRGVSFLTVPADGGGLRPLFAGIAAAENPRGSVYGPVRDLAPSARRFDQSVPYLAFSGAPAALSLVEKVGREAIGAHDRALARRFRDGLTELGHRAVPGDSPIVAVPGLGTAVPALRRAGVELSERAGGLRASFHVHNTEEDVDRVLRVLAEHPPVR